MDRIDLEAVAQAVFSHSLFMLFHELKVLIRARTSSIFRDLRCEIPEAEK